MSDPSIVQVERLIEELYSSNDALLTKHIQEQLQALQKQPYAWEIASQLLASQSKQCQFFGAHTFQVKITQHWKTLPEDKVQWLKNELLRWIVRLCGGPAFVTTKLCTALIAFAFHTTSDQWPRFISATVEALQQESHVYGVPVDMANSAILEFLTLVPEEMSNTNVTRGRKLQLIEEVNNSIELVLFTISSNLYSPTPTDSQQKSLRCLQSWVQHGFDLEKGYTMLQRVMSLLGEPELFEPAGDVLMESIQQSRWNRYHNFRDELLTCFTSEAMKEKFESCMAEEDEETASVIAKLLTAFGETYTDYIATQLARPDIYWLMTMIIQLSDFKGFFPVDQEVTEIPLNFWYNLQETLFDECILPVKQLLPVDQENSAENQWKFSCGQAALAIYRELVKIWTRGACFPDELTWGSWHKDIKDKFKIWRRDLGDTMINPYFILREEMLAILLDHTVYIMNQWKSLPNASQSLEGTLFCLKSISEEIAPDENLYVAQFFGPEVLGRLPVDCGSRLKSTVLILMGSLADWLKTHPQYLGSVMNYIVPCLSDPQLALAAGSAFSDISDACRESLVNELDGLMRVYAAMTSSNIKPNIMQKVVESVANAIQVLPPDKSMGPLMSLTGDILQGISKALANVDKDPQGSHDIVLAQLQYLSACCRGIQSPNDDYQSLGVRNSVYDAFASGQLLAMYAHIDGFSQVTYAIRESSSQIARTWGSDEQIAKALSAFLEQGMRSTNPLLSLDFINLAALVETSYVAAPFACWLDTASFMMTVYGGQQMHFERLRDLVGVITTKTLSFIYGVEAMENHPDVVDSYYGLLSRAITRCPLAFYQLPPDIMNTIFLFVIAGMGLQEKLALKAALNFMGIGGRVPRSFSGPLVDVLFKIIGKYLQPSRRWLHTLLSMDGFPSALVNASDKEMFLKGVLGQGIKRPKSPLISNHAVASHNPIQLAAISNYKLAQLTFAPPDLHSLRKTAVIKNMLQDVYTSTPPEWLQQMVRWQYFTPESLEEMTQAGLEEIFQQYVQTIEAFRPVKPTDSYQYDDDLFDEEDDGQGDDLWIATEDEHELPLPSFQLQGQQSQLQEQEQESCQSKTNSIDSCTSSIFSQPNATISNESIGNDIPARAPWPRPLSEKPLPASPNNLGDDTAKQARRKSGFAGGKNRLSWTSDTGITSSIVSQNLANEIMSLFDMDFAIDIKVDTAPKLPELPFKPRRRSQQRQSQDMLTSLIPAFEKIAMENSLCASSAPTTVKTNLVVRSVPQRSSSLRNRQQAQSNTLPVASASPPITPSDSPPVAVEKTLSKKKSLLRLASLMAGKKASHKDLPNSPEPSPITPNGAYYHESPTVILSSSIATTTTASTKVVNTPRKTSTSTVDSSTSSSSSSWSFVTENGELKTRSQKPLPEPPCSPSLAPSNGSHTTRSKRSVKKKRKSVMEKTMSKRKSSNGLQTAYNGPSSGTVDTKLQPQKGLGRSKSAFIKIGNGLKSRKQPKQIRRTSSAKDFSQQQKQSDINPRLQYQASAESNNMYTGTSEESMVLINGSQQSFVKRMASFNWRMKPKNKAVVA
ncbi:hypothetical protein [Parasitella parasitica]|uniref:Importin-13 n=1 Tax=Parasitella parasitica TaxID=35722 RepID=A0A0B7NCX6_9FUNG|nr:hypothetical protein [Parasitella parasitica]